MSGIAFLYLHPYATAVSPVQRPHLGTSRRCRVGRNCQRRRKTLLPLAGGPAPRSPPPLTPTPIYIFPLPHPTSPPSPPPQATLYTCPHCFRHSPIRPPQNLHQHGYSPDRHPRPHRRRRHLAPLPIWVR